MTSKMPKLIQEKAMEDVFLLALEIVEEVMFENTDLIMPTASLPTPVNLTHQSDELTDLQSPLT